MAICSEMHPPTGITHCCSSYFTHVPRQARENTKSLPDVIIVRTNLLQIFQVRVPHNNAEATTLIGSHLEQLASIPLAGLVESIAVLRGRSSSQKDALLLTFRDAKLSVLDWDDNAHTIHTSSLHYFEGDPSLRMGRTVFPLGPKVVTDPQGRCAAVLMFNTQLALLPAMETEGLELDLMMDDPYGEGVGGPGGAPAELVSATVGNSYVVNLAKMGIKQVKDIVFLHKYNEPVLLILHEVAPTWAGRYRDCKDTMAFAALSINVVHKRHPRIWEASGLPSDTFKLIPVPTGGAVALSQNMIMHFTQGAFSALVVNSHALPGKVPEKLEIDIEGDVLPAQLAAEHAAKYSNNVHPEAAPFMAGGADQSAAHMMVDLSAARHVWLTKTALLLLLKSGQMLLAHLTIEAGTVKHIKVEPSLHPGVASCACQLHSRLVFLGSCMDNSLLVHVTDRQGMKKRGRPGVDEDAPLSKRGRLEGPNTSGLGSQISAADEEEELKQAKNATVQDRRFLFKVIDTMAGIGPMRDMTIGEAVSSAPGAVPGQGSSRGPPQLVACSGQGKQGALSILRRNLVPELILKTPTPGVKQIWGVHHTDTGTDTGMQLEQQGGPHHAFLFMSDPGANTTTVMRLGDGMDRVLQEESSGIMFTAPTLAAGNVLNYTRVVQVYPAGLKVLSGVEEVQDLPIQDILPSMEWRPGVVIAAACILDPYVLLHFSDGSAILLSGDPEEGELVGEDANQALQADINADPTTRLQAATLYKDTSDWLARVHSAASAEAAESTAQAADAKGQGIAGEQPHDMILEVEDGGLEGGQEGVAEQAAPVKQEKNGEEGQQPAPASDEGENVHVPEEEEAQSLEQNAESKPSVATFGEEIPAGNENKTEDQSVDQQLRQSQAGSATESDAAASQAAAGLHDTSWQAAQHAKQALAKQQHSDVPVVDAPTDTGAPTSGSWSNNAPVKTFIVLCRENGLLQIFTLPEMQLLFTYTNPSDGPLLLTQGGSSPPQSEEEEVRVQVVEARMESFGPRDASDGSMLAYQAFRAPHQPLAFQRLPLDWIPHQTPLPPRTVPHANAVQPTQRIQKFDNIGEKGPAWAGIFVTGPKPLWLLPSRGTLIAHPMEVEGAVAGFTAFHNINCAQGFITTDGGERSGSLNICQMPNSVQLENPWPVQRVPLHATPHRVSFYPEARLYALLVSKAGPHKQWLEAEEGGDMHAAYSYALAKESAKIKSQEFGFEVWLVQPGLWKTIWSYALGPAEDALCIKALTLKNSQKGGSEPLVAVGTCQCFGEDYPATGRVLFFQITRKSGGNGKEEEEWDTNMIYSREFRGPVTNLTSLEGYIILTIGNRLETHQWTGSNLLRTAFFDAPILISSLNVVKTFILFGDVHKGIYFVQYRDQGKQLNLLSKDFDNSDISATEFVINGSQLHFLAADEGLNVRLFKYDNKNPQSWKGQKLLPLGCLHTGQRVTRFLAQRLVSTDSTPRHAAVYATQAGSLGYVAPLLNDSMEPVLQKLQQQLALAQPQAAGLNPAAFRRRFQHSSKALAGGQHFGKPLPSNGVVDGKGLAAFQHLPRSVQSAVVEKIGSNREVLLGMLTVLASANSFF